MGFRNHVSGAKNLFLSRGKAHNDQMANVIDMGFRKGQSPFGRDRFIKFMI